MGFEFKGEILVFTDDNGNETAYKLNKDQKFIGNNTTALGLWESPGEASVVVKSARKRSDAVKANFLNEAKVLRQLHQTPKGQSHLNIVELLEVLPGGTSLVLEYVPGQDMFDYLDAYTFADVQYQDVMLKLWMALVWVHGNGIVHADMKPENVLIAILINGEIIPKLCDFGDAKLSGSKPDPKYVNAGTGFTRSPELLEAYSKFSTLQHDEWQEEHMPQPADDVYSMAVLMLSALSGHYLPVFPILINALASYDKKIKPTQSIGEIEFSAPELMSLAHRLLNSGGRDYVNAINWCQECYRSAGEAIPYLADPSAWQRGEVEVEALRQPQNQQYDLMSTWPCEIDGRPDTALTLFKRCLGPRRERPTAAQVVSWLTPGHTN